MDASLADRLAIRDVVETWASARDSGDWEAFRACWHDDGYMMATWFQGPKEDFIRVSQEGAARGVNILHFTGGCRITLTGSRAIAQTRMTIMQRGEVEGVLCDVACTGRFYDFLEKRDNRWGIVLRQPIYEKDRLDPVDPAASLVLDPELLARYPEGYRYLAYLQVQAGYPVKPDMPGLRGPEVGAPVPARRRLAGRGAGQSLGPAGQHDLVGAGPRGLLLGRPYQASRVPRRTSERSSGSDPPVAPSARAWTSTLPQEAASVGPATTGSPQAPSAISWNTVLNGCAAIPVASYSRAASTPPRSPAVSMTAA